MRIQQLFFLLLILTLSACGQKGPLYLPQDEAPATPPSAQQDADDLQEEKKQTNQ